VTKQYLWPGLMRNTIKWGQNNIYMAWLNGKHNKMGTKQYMWPGLLRNTIKWGHLSQQL
jgi:hypothetical protein